MNYTDNHLIDPPADDAVDYANDMIANADEDELIAKAQTLGLFSKEPLRKALEESLFEYYFESYVEDPSL